MRKTAFLLLALAAAPTMAATGLYVAKLRILGTDGKFQEYVIQSTARGLEPEQCRLALKVWLAENGPTFDATVKTLQAQGKQTAYSVECEPMD